MTRPDRDTVLALLATRGTTVTARTSEPTEDVDGMPLGIESTEHDGLLWVTPESLGWTWDELGVDREDYE